MGMLNEGFVEIAVASAALSAELRATLAQHGPTHGVPDALGAARAPGWLEHWLSALRRFSTGTGDAQGLHGACLCVQDNLAALARAPQDLTERHVALCARLPDLIDDYIRGHDLPQSVDAWLRLVADSHWPLPLGAAQAALLRERLHSDRTGFAEVPPIVATLLKARGAGVNPDSTRESATYAAMRDPSGPTARADLSEQRRVPRDSARECDSPGVSSGPECLGSPDPQSGAAAAPPSPPLHAALAQLHAAAEQLAAQDPARPGPDAVAAVTAALHRALECCATHERAQAWTEVLKRLHENLWPLRESAGSAHAAGVDRTLPMMLLDASQSLLALVQQQHDAQLCDTLLNLLASSAWSLPLHARGRPALRMAFGFSGHAKFDPIPHLDAEDSAFAPMTDAPVTLPAPPPPQPRRDNAATPAAETGLMHLADALARIARAGEALATVVEPGQACREALAAYRDAVNAAVEPARAEPASMAWLDLLSRIDENLEVLAATARNAAAPPPDTAVTMALLDLPQLAMALHARADDSQLCDALLGTLSASALPIPLSADEAPALRVAFGFAPHSRFDPIPDIGAPDSAFAALDRLEDADARPPPAAAPQRCDSEHLAVLSQEFAAFALGLHAEMEDARAERPAPARREAIERHGEMLRRIGETCGAIGLSALEEVFAQIGLRAGRVIDTGLSEAQCLWLRGIVQHVRAYLGAPNDPSAAGAMVEVLADGSWPPALPRADAARLEAALIGVELFTDARLRPQRAREARAADVSLELPRDIDPELLDGLLSELPLQSAGFAAAMERVVSGQATLYDLEVAKRAAHTLKGAANTVGVRGIASLTHHLEDVLIALTRLARMPTRELTHVLVRAADCLEAMSEAVQGVADAPGDAQQVLQHVLDWANRFDQDGADALARPDAPESTGTDAATQQPVQPDAARSPAAHAAQAGPTQPPSQGEAHASPDEAAEAGPGAPQAMLRVPAALVDDLLRLVGETMIANTQIKEQLRQTSDHAHAVTRQNLNLQQLAAELETLVDIRGMSGDAVAVAKAGQVFDTLEFERFNELHTVTRRLVEAATDSRELSSASEERLKALSELLDMQGRLHAENQKAVVGARMVPVSGVVSRLQRSVRQTCRLLDKPAELNVLGAQTQLDVNILNELLDPLMHMLRNAVDHGVEPAAQRASLGKPSSGRIELSFATEGAWVVVRCADDGAGLDIARIRTKAIERGLLGEGQAVPDEELARCVLLPGFSTRDDSTEVSGRGIGMDAVYSRVLALKGSLRLINRPALGLTVELRVPTSLMTTHGLLVRVEDQVLALTSFGIGGIHYVASEQVRKMGASEVFKDGDQVHHLLRLGALLGRGERRASERGWFPALLVHTDSGMRRAIQVQDVLDHQELVVKKLGKYVPNPPGVVGVTILGDGSIAPVLDLPQLLRELAEDAGAQVRRGHSAAPKTGSRIEARLSALVVDDSLSARRLVAQVMRDIGLDVRTAIDGMEAAAILSKVVPDIVIVDMEMPRMNGLELTTHIRSRDATRHLPVIMITSRSTEKHRQLAESAGVDVYLTKPFNDAELERHVHRLTAEVKAA
jgi:chemotaxis protein histidine kinase CheA/ActR/RegA family two-component response regulator